LNNRYRIISLVVSNVDSSSSVETYKIICTSSALNLDHDWIVIRVVIVVCNANNSLGNIGSFSWVNCLHSIIVPSELKAFCRVETHCTAVIRVTGISHVASVVGVGLSIKPPRMGQVEIVSEFMHLNPGHVVVITLVNGVPRVDVCIRSPSAINIAPLKHVHDLLIRTRQVEAKLFLHCSGDSVPDSISAIISQGNWNSNLHYTWGLIHCGIPRNNVEFPK